MNLEKHITASCVIFNHTVVKNGAPLFEDSGVDLNEFLTGAYKYLQTPYPKFYKMDNISKLGWLATEVLLKESFDRSKYENEEVAVLLSNSNSSLDSDMKYWESVNNFASPALFVYTLPNIVVGEICIRNGFKGENAFWITEQFDATVIYKQVIASMEYGAKACICGWVDVLGDNYKAVLFLIEEANGNATPFSVANIERIRSTNE